jgi:hypothetical protein
MTPARKAALITRAKAVAIPVASCVAARLRPDHLLPSLSRAELMALVIVLAEAADPAVLREVVHAEGDMAAGPVPLGGYTEGRKNAVKVKDYAVLRMDGCGVGEAAVRLGVTKRTGERYEAELVRAGKAPWRGREQRRAA